MKIQIFYASIGSGHYVAASAMKHALDQFDGTEIQMFDILEPIKTDLIKISEISSLFSFLIAPNAYDKAWQTGNLHGLYELICTIDILQTYLLDCFMKFRPDIVIFTHSLPCSVFCKIADNQKLVIPIIAIATDFNIHRYWPLESITQFIVGSDIGVRELVHRGFTREKICLLGIPINTKFMNYSMKQRIQNANSIKNVLVLAGGRQVAPYVSLWPKIVTIIRNIAKLHNQEEFQWTVVSGSNLFFEKYLALITDNIVNIEIVKFIEDMPLQIFYSDVVLTKPGGLILAECMALCKPVILLTRGAGQEAANTDYLLEKQAALISEDPTTTIELITNILASDELTKLSHNARKLGYPNAAEEIAQYILTFQ